jgi:hypothetical protein
MVLLGNNIIVTSYAQQDISSPLKQFRSGTLWYNVICQPNLTLIIKLEDYSPACVTTQTAEKLIARFWGMNHLDIRTEVGIMVTRWDATNSTEHPVIYPVDYGTMAKYPILQNIMEQADQQFNSRLVPVCGYYEKWWNVKVPEIMKNIPCLNLLFPTYMAKQMINNPDMKFSTTDNGIAYETYLSVGDANYRILLSMR